MEKFFKHPRWIIAIIAAITVFFALQIPRVQLDNNNFRFVPEKDPERIAMKRVDDSFGSQTIILVGLERKHGTVLEADFLDKLRSFDKKIADIAIVESATSIVSTDYLTGEGDAIVAQPLVPEDFGGTGEEIAALKDKLLSWDLYSRALVSEDFAGTQMIVYLDIPAEDAGKPEVVAVHKAIKKFAAETGFKDTNVYITGMPVFGSVVNDATRSDLITLVPLVVIVVVFVLFLSFRRLSGVLLPLLTVLVSVVWAVGAMPLFGIKLSILSTVLPVILVAVGSAYGIHVVSHYYDEIAGKRDLSEAEHRAIVFAVLRRIGKPVLLAALTTFAGFGSFCFTKVIPIFEFGIFSSFGVLVAYGTAITLIPAILLIRGPAKKLPRFKTSEMEPGEEDPLSGAIADALGHIIAKKRTVLFIACAVIFVSLIGVSHLVIDNVLVEYFKPDTDVVLSDRFIRDKFGGSKSVSVVVSSEIPGEVLRPDVLAAMDGLALYLKESVPEVGKTSGFTDLIKRVNQVFNADESPEGLKPSVAAIAATGAAKDAPSAAAAPGSEPAFGFGFSETTSAEPAAPVASADESASGAKADKTAEKIDSLAMVALLNKALAEKGGEAMTARELVESLSRLTNYRGASYYEIPTDPARYGKTSQEELKSLISNYLVLLSGNIGSYADDPLEPKAIRMDVQLRTVGQIDTNRGIRAMEDYIEGRFPKDVKVEIAGSALVEKSLNSLVVQSQLVSVALSLIMVFLILAIYYRSAIAGLIGLAPLSVSILINFAVMGLTGIKLNIGTAMVASIAVGVGIDYTIHYMAAFHHEYLLTKGKGDFLRRTFLTSGKAILFNATSVGAGFAVLAFSQFNILASLGLLIALTMATSALVSLTLLPVLLILVNPAFIRRPLPSDKASHSTEVSP
ncbi:MAG TPA: efflux RND transporter permease subunit [Rectinemataceae bacterium]|nr:efflux RND transporter permease subunit [Rectinemataceae bacterium]